MYRWFAYPDDLSRIECSKLELEVWCRFDRLSHMCPLMKVLQVAVRDLASEGGACLCIACLEILLPAKECLHVRMLR